MHDRLQNKTYKNQNRRAYGDSSEILESLDSLTEKPPLQTSVKWWEHVTSYLLENNGMPCATLKTDGTTPITMENYDSVLCPGMPVYCISDVDPVYAIYIGNEMLVRPSSHIQRLRTEPLHVLLSRYQTILPARLYQSSDNG